MAGFCVGTMSSADGWETKSPQRAMALHFMYWLASRRSQGKVIPNVPSFYYLWGKFGRNPTEMVRATKDAFDLYVKELFPVSEVEVDIQYQNDTKTVYHLVIAAKFVYNGVSYDMAKAVLVTGELFKVLETERYKR